MEIKGECGGRGAKGVGPGAHVKDFPPKSKEEPWERSTGQDVMGYGH